MVKTIAIMQPYFFPYIGYFQLINAADTFVIYDNVNFIKQGWVNRNYILNDKKDQPFLFSLPVNDVSSNRLIYDTHISEKYYDRWVHKFLKTLKLTYSKAPFYSNVIELIKAVFESKNGKLSEYLGNSIKLISTYLGIKTDFIYSSEIALDHSFTGKQKVIELCKSLQADIYINAIGGQELYDYDNFADSGIVLKFIQSNNIKYEQFNNTFVPYLSIIDVMMFNSRQTISTLLNEYELLTNK